MGSFWWVIWGRFLPSRAKTPRGFCRGMSSIPIGLAKAVSIKFCSQPETMRADVEKELELINRKAGRSKRGVVGEIFWSASGPVSTGRPWFFPIEATK